MKPYPLLFTLLAALPLIPSCSAKNSSQPVIIEKMYATSVESDSAPAENIFVKGESWRSAPSSHVLEGIMLYILDPDFATTRGQVRLGDSRIGHFRILCEALNLKVYVNGSEPIETKCGEKLRVKDQPLISSLFIEAESRFDSPDSVEIESVEFLDSADKPMSVVYPRSVPGELKASSVQSPAMAYDPSLLFDGRREFGWVEGAEGDGAGESLSMRTDEELVVSGLEIYPGYQRSDDHFEKNGTPLKLVLSGGGRSEEFSVSNRTGSQRINLASPLKGREFTLTLKEIRTGSKWKDTVISELILLGPENERYTIADRNRTKRLTAFRSEIDSGLLKSMTGRLMESGVPGENFFRMVLRNNGSFVIWREFDRSESGELSEVKSSGHIVMDGNWLLEENGTDRARVKIFGKLREISFTTRRELSPDDGPYSETSSSDNKNSTEIFSDGLTLTPDSDSSGIRIEGERVSGLFQ